MSESEQVKIAETSKEEYDADMAYESYRELWGNQLEECCIDMFNAFVVRKHGGYYKNKSERFYNDANMILKRICGVTTQNGGKNDTGN